MPKPPLRKPKKKVCVFCQDRIAYVDYKDTGLLRNYISDRGKIRARRVTGNCTRHQRDVATAIKNAREDGAAAVHEHGALGSKADESYTDEAHPHPGSERSRRPR